MCSVISGLMHPDCVSILLSAVQVTVLFAGQHISKSPFEVEVGMAQGDSSKATAQGPGLEPSGNIANKSTYFEVYTAGNKDGISSKLQGWWSLSGLTAVAVRCRCRRGGGGDHGPCGEEEHCDLQHRRQRQQQLPLHLQTHPGGPAHHLCHLRWRSDQQKSLHGQRGRGYDRNEP